MEIVLGRRSMRGYYYYHFRIVVEGRGAQSFAQQAIQRGFLILRLQRVGWGRDPHQEVAVQRYLVNLTFHSAFMLRSS